MPKCYIDPKTKRVVEWRSKPRLGCGDSVWEGAQIKILTVIGVPIIGFALWPVFAAFGLVD